MNDAIAQARLLYQSGNIADALIAWKSVLQDRPDYAEALLMAGICCQQSAMTAEALVFLNQARLADPSDPYIAYNLALSLTLDRQHVAALPLAAEAASKVPAEAGFLLTLGNIHMALNDPAAAITAYNHALDVRPDYPEARYNRGLCHLLLGNYVDGWPDWEYRWRSPSFTSPVRQFSCPQWGGENLTGKHLHIHAEQGLGDCLQMLRFVPQLQTDAAKISIEVKPALSRLLHQSFPDLPVYNLGDRPPGVPDFHIPMMSLPGCLAVTPETIPPAWCPVTTKTSAIRRHGPMRVGLVWAGNPNHPRDQERSLPLEALKNILDIPQIDLFSFQVDDPARDVRRKAWRNKVTDLSAELSDFTDTRDQLANMDLLISVDSVVAHLAASMNLPVWLLISHAPDWRWMLNRSDSPWYPSVTLFRQQEAGNWESPVARILEKLATVSHMTGQSG